MVILSAHPNLWDEAVDQDVAESNNLSWRLPSDSCYFMVHLMTEGHHSDSYAKDTSSSLKFNKVTHLHLAYRIMSKYQDFTDPVAQLEN